MSSQSVSVRTAAEIRSSFIEFFRSKHAHAFVASSPVVPHDDPTLLFTNAGMNQFKEVFLGQGTADGGATRAVNSQKCIRAGGKHNDLEDVGKDTYHHTFFEMLGNWSFGDYFKTEAIEWAWELLTSPDWWGLDPERLYVTVFEGDAGDGLEPDLEAEELWKRFVPAERISRWGKKDNFWEMGETGPCGPCSEIHYDFTPDGSGGKLVNADHPDVIELWNLVFIQFNRAPGGVLTPLPAQHVDTGMGLERIVRTLQGKSSNYDTDLWTTVFDAIKAHTGAHPYGGAMNDPIDVAYRVIADHVRCLTVALTDGARPGSDGRDYVLRRILRRAVRHAHQTLGVEGPVLCDLVPAVVETLGGAFPELTKKPDAIAAIIRDEEESFLRTLDRGIALFDEAAVRCEGAPEKRITAVDAFRLHDTFGFPIDLTRVMAEERGLGVDESGYQSLMEEARDRSRQGGRTHDQLTLPPDALARLKHLGVRPTDDAPKYEGRPVATTVRAIWNGSDFDEIAHTGDACAVILERTNHYAEAGGQVGDRGEILIERCGAGTSGSLENGLTRFAVEDTQMVGGFVLHEGRVVEGRLTVHDEATVSVEAPARDRTEANHSATHLLNHALRTVIGDDEDQRGSLVAPDRLRFDFTASHALSAADVERVETLVREAIGRGATVHAEVVALADAQRIRSLRAVFGEKYPDPVRVVSIGATVSEMLAAPDDERWDGHSVELCGGTHVATTGSIDRFVIASEQALASGVRRIIALTGPAAHAAEAVARDVESRIAATGGLDDAALLLAFDGIQAEWENLAIGVTARHRLATSYEGLRERVKTIRKKSAGAARTDVVEQARVIADTVTGPVITATLDGAGKDTILPAMDAIRSKHEDAAVMLFAPDDESGKVAIAAAVAPALIERGLKAGDWVRVAAQVCGGGGGGRPDLAQAGGTDPGKIDDARRAAEAFAQEKLG